MRSFDIGLVDIEQHVGNTPQVTAPTLARLAKQIHERPLWMTKDVIPLEVDVDTYKQARDEMIAIQRERGFPLATAIIGRDNFLLRGIPVVIA